MEEKYGNSIFDIWRGITAGRIMYLRPLWLALILGMILWFWIYPMVRSIGITG